MFLCAFASSFIVLWLLGLVAGIFTYGPDAVTRHHMLLTREEAETIFTISFGWALVYSVYKLIRFFWKASQ